MPFSIKGYAALAGAAVVGLGVLGGIVGTAYTISPQEVGVITRWGEIIRDHQLEGLHFKVPYIDTLHTFPTTIMEVGTTSPANTYTVDNQEVDVTWKLFFRVPADKAGFVFKNVPDYQQRLYVMTAARVKTGMGMVNIQQLAEKRGTVSNSIMAVLKHDASLIGLEIVDFNLTDLTYDKTYRAAVSQAAVKKANIEQAEYERLVAEKQAQRDQTEALGKANAARETAKGAADARLSMAEAESKAIKLEGVAVAEAAKLKNDALKGAPDLVEYTKASRWNGALPQTMLGSAMPFMQVGPGGAAPAAH